MREIRDQVCCAIRSSGEQMKKYKLMYHQYNIFSNNYEYKEKIIETDDIYHEIGKLYCTELCDIKRVNYKEIKNSEVKE